MGCLRPSRPHKWNAKCCPTQIQQVSTAFPPEARERLQRISGDDYEDDEEDVKFYDSDERGADSSYSEYSEDFMRYFSS